MARAKDAVAFLIANSRRNDDLFRSHGDWLHQQLARRLRMQAADVDDLVQESFLRATRQSTCEIVYPRALLSKIALNLFRDRKRREAVRAGHGEAVRQNAAQENSALGGLGEQEVQLELERLIAAMPEIYRDVFALSRFRHMTNKDIASHLGLSIKTVEWRMGKALEYCVRRLRTRLAIDDQESQSGKGTGTSRAVVCAAKNAAGLAHYA